MYTEKIKSMCEKYITGKFIHKLVAADELLLDYTIISHALTTHMDEDTRYRAKELERVIKDEILCRMTRPFID